MKLICPLGWPFNKTRYWTDDIHSIISLIQRESNPILWRRTFIKSHSTQSYALLISVLIAINLFWHDLLVLNSWKISWTIIISSEMNLPDTNAYCVSDISLGRHDFNLWHKILEMILYPTLQRLLGLSSIILVGCSVLGIMHMFVVLSRGSISPLTKKNY